MLIAGSCGSAKISASDPYRGVLLGLAVSRTPFGSYVHGFYHNLYVLSKGLIH